MQALQQLCLRLAQGDLEHPDIPQRLAWCAEADVFGWFVPKQYGGLEWTDAQQIEGYLAISQVCLTTAFVLTQWNAACKRIAQSPNSLQRERWLPSMARGHTLATVGISHLTTSRQHVATPVLRATQQPDGAWTLDGFSPWVTAGIWADLLVVGGTAVDGRQILCAVPANRAGIQIGPGMSLVALAGSATDAVQFHQVRVEADEILAGPVENVMHTGGGGGGAGGLQTSTLAIGLTLAAVGFLQAEASKRPDLRIVVDKLAQDAEELRAGLMTLASGQRTWSRTTEAGTTGSVEELNALTTREKANSLVLRATQAALVAAKGAGLVSGHPAGRWCREALFFLVWSCPQPVLAANLCEFAQV